jgi:hypothetical protein
MACQACQGVGSCRSERRLTPSRASGSKGLCDRKLEACRHSTLEPQYAWVRRGGRALTFNAERIGPILKGSIVSWRLIQPPPIGQQGGQEKAPGGRDGIPGAGLLVSAHSFCRHSRLPPTPAEEPCQGNCSRAQEGDATGFWNSTGRNVQGDVKIRVKRQALEVNFD